MGNNLALQNSVLDTTGTGVLTCSAGVNAPTFGGLTGVNNLTLPSNVTALTLNLGLGVSETYCGALGGATGMTVTKAGSGVQTLSGTNNYSGATNVNGGTLEVLTPASLPNYAVAVAGGATLAVPTGDGVTDGWTSAQIGSLLTSASWANNIAVLNIVTSNANLTYGGSITQGLALTKTGGGTVTLTGANTYTGPTTVVAGALQLNNANAVQNSVVVVDANAGLSFGTGIGTFNLGGLSGAGNFGLADTGGSAVALNAGAAGGNTTYSGNLTGSGSLNKVGSGLLELSNANYQGPTTVTAGTLQIDGWTDSTNMSIASGASLVFNDNYFVEFGGANASISGGGQFVKAGTGSLSLLYGTSNSYTGGTIISAGKLTVGGPLSLGSSNANVTIDSGAVLVLNGNSIGVGNLAGSGTIDNSLWPGSVVTLGNNNAGVTFGCTAIGIAVDKVGSGTMTFQPGNVYNFSAFQVSNGTLNLSAGTLAIQSGSELDFGYNAGQNVVGTLSGGQLIADLQEVGGCGAASFTQSGGTNNSAIALYAGTWSGGSGTYTLTGSGALSPFRVIVGQFGQGNFIQSGGTQNITSAASTGAGLYVGYASSGSYTLSGSGRILTPAAYVGYWSGGEGTFVQNGGTNTISGDLGLGYFYSSSGSYSLKSGQLSAVNEWLGMEGTGVFTQNGGVNTLSGTLCLGDIAGATGTYNLNGGTLAAALVSVGSGSGFLNFNGGFLMGGLTKVGGGQLTVSGLNGYTSGTIVSDGTLTIANGGALPNGTGSDRRRRRGGGVRQPRRQRRPCAGASACERKRGRNDLAHAAAAVR